MNFEFTDEQQMLADTARDLLAKAYDPEQRTAVLDTELGWSPNVWKTLTQTGLLGLPFAEEDGGMDAGPVETMAVMTEIGRRLAPEPFLDTVVLAGGLIADVASASQRRELLSDVAAGELVLAFAHTEPGGRWPADEIATTAVTEGASWVLRGTKNPVLHGDCADRLIVSAALPRGGVGLFLVDPADAAVRVSAYRTHDGGRGAQVDLTGAPATALGDPVDRAAAIKAAQIRVQAALCAEAVGAMDEALRLTTDYLKTRKQFGVPLAKFQTLTQRAADMYVALELARSMSLYATMSLADGLADPVIASRAKLQVARAARLIGQEAIQMHGGIGLTAEYPVGHYAARLTAIEHTLGGADDHLRRLTEHVGDHAMVTVAG